MSIAIPSPQEAPPVPVLELLQASQPCSATIFPSRRHSLLTIIIDGRTDAVLAEGPERVAPEVVDLLREELGQGREIACAAPATMCTVAAASRGAAASEPCVRITGYDLDSLIEGPGRRSVVKFQGCGVRCRGCITAESWSFRGGTLVPVEGLVEALLDPAYERDGISVVGGELFAQPYGLLALVRALQAHGCLHLLVYSGYTYKQLRRIAKQRPAIDAVLDEINVLIDGPYVEAFAGDVGSWTGSGNQRVIDMVETRRTGRLALLDGGLPDGCVRPTSWHASRE